MKTRMKALVRTRDLRLAALLAASTVIAPLAFSARAQASPEFDRRYSLQTVGALRSSDNVDGLFNDYVARALKDYFESRPRFTLQDLSTAQVALDRSGLPYSQLIDDTKVLEKLARSARSETLLRTRIFKEGPRYRFTLDWLHAPRMDVLASEVFTIDEPRNGGTLGAEAIRGQILSAMDRLIAKVPFVANLSGRDGDSVTVSGGDNLGLRKGDTLWVGTIDDVKKHPLLGVLAEWKIARTGALRVDSVDHGMAFCTVTEEDPAQPITRGQKITRIVKAEDPIASMPTEHASDEAPIFDRTDAPRVGWISAAPMAGLFTRSLNTGSTSTSSRILYGARADALVWLNREWFTEGSIGYGDFSTGALTAFAASLGYSYLPGLDFFGAKGWVKAGYHSRAYRLPINSGDGTNPVTWSGLMLGVGGDLPLRGGWGAQMNLDFGVLRSMKETGGSRSAPTGTTLVDFYLGMVYRMRPRLIFRLGAQFQAQGADFSDGSSLSHQAITLLPSFVVPF